MFRCLAVERLQLDRKCLSPSLIVPLEVTSPGLVEFFEGLAPARQELR